MLRTRTFVWHDNKAKNWYGWKPEGTPDSFYPGRGHLSAHDTLEHVSDKTDWAHELRAFGFILFGRGSVDDEVMSTMADDILNFAIVEHGGEVPEAPARYERKLDAEGERTLGLFMENVRRGWNTGMFVSQVTRQGELHAKGKAFGPNIERLARWLRRGYRAAQRVYGKGNGRKVSALFSLISDSLGWDHDRQRIKHGMGNAYQPGDKLTLTVDTETLEWTAVVKSQGKRARNVSVPTTGQAVELARELDVPIPEEA